MGQRAPGRDGRCPVRGTVLALCGMLAGWPAAAQWSTVTEHDAEPSRSVATVLNEGGARLRIWVDDDDRLRAAFRLPHGLVILAPDVCPTFQVDDRPIEDLSTPEHACSTSADEATLTLSQTGDGEVNSATLLELMNGTRLTVRYRLTHAGYSATEFTLKRSKQALSDALGEGLSVQAD